MLKEPKHGWSQITIGNWSDRCSYLDDVPFLLLEGVEGVCRTGNPVAAKFDAEGWEYLIVFDVYETHIITETDNGYTLTTEDVRIKNLVEELVADIRRDLKAWSCWTDYGDMSDDEKSEREKDLAVLCDILEKRKEWRV